MTSEALRYGAAPRRRGWILERLHSVGFVSVTDLAEELGVSDMTVRRDLHRLTRDGQVRVVRGGVSLPHPTLRTSQFVARAKSNAAAKQAIARRATAMIKPTDTVAIDAGTTTYALTHQLPASFTGCVVTHSVPVMQALLEQPQVSVIGLGGHLLPSSQAFVGERTVEQARSLRVRLLFLGAASIDVHGVYAEADVEQSIKLALAETADQVVLLADCAKFGRVAPLRLCGLERLTRVITDRTPPEDLRAALAHAHVDLAITESSR